MSSPGRRADHLARHSRAFFWDQPWRPRDAAAADLADPEVWQVKAAQVACVMRERTGRRSAPTG